LTADSDFAGGGVMHSTMIDRGEAACHELAVTARG
jgi:hypothetical protein